MKCQQTWMPIFFHSLDILRVNGYIIYSHTSVEHKDVDPKDIHGQKGFLKELIHSLIVRAGQAQVAETRREASNQNDQGPRLRALKSSVNQDCCKNHTFTLSRSNPTLKQWSKLKETCPCQIEKAKQGPCRYCSYLNFLDAKNGVTNPHKVERMYWKCPHCQVPLCKGRCFDSFHNW